MSAEEFWKTTAPSGSQEQKLRVVFLKDGSSPQREALEKQGTLNRPSGAVPSKAENELYVSMVNRPSEQQVNSFILIISY